MGEKENSPKLIGWMEAWWMSFSFRLSIYHSWFPGEYGWIRWPCLDTQKKRCASLCTASYTFHLPSICAMSDFLLEQVGICCWRGHLRGCFNVSHFLTRMQFELELVFQTTRPLYMEFPRIHDFGNSKKTMRKSLHCLIPLSASLYLCNVGLLAGTSWHLLLEGSFARVLQCFLLPTYTDAVWTRTRFPNHPSVVYGVPSDTWLWTFKKNDAQVFALPHAPFIFPLSMQCRTSCWNKLAFAAGGVICEGASMFPTSYLHGCSLNSNSFSKRAMQNLNCSLVGKVRVSSKGGCSAVENLAACLPKGRYLGFGWFGIESVVGSERFCNCLTQSGGSKGVVSGLHFVREIWASMHPWPFTIANLTLYSPKMIWLFTIFATFLIPNQGMVPFVMNCVKLQRLFVCGVHFWKLLAMTTTVLCKLTWFVGDFQPLVLQNWMSAWSLWRQLILTCYPFFWREFYESCQTWIKVGIWWSWSWSIKLVQFPNKLRLCIQPLRGVVATIISTLGMVCPGIKKVPIERWKPRVILFWTHGLSPKPFATLSKALPGLRVQWTARPYESELLDLRPTLAPVHLNVDYGVSVLGGPLVVQVSWAASTFKATSYYSVHPLILSATRHASGQTNAAGIGFFEKTCYTSAGKSSILGNHLSVMKVC